MIRPTPITDADQILLQTKLHRPHLSQALITRPRLIELFNNGIEHPLTLVCAPAGFGKTTLVCSSLDQMNTGQGEKSVPLPSAWLSLDENDSDLNLFILYLIAALRTIFENACEKTLVMVQSRQAQSPTILYASISNDIEQLPKDFVLVLDDYHLIKGKEVHNLLNAWIYHWPQPMHLVLISRISPPLSLSNLRAKGLTTEFRIHQLR